MASKPTPPSQGEFQDRVQEPTATPKSAIVMEPEAPAPGSRAFIEQNPLLTDADKAAMMRYTDEAIAERTADRPPTPGLKIIKDEWYGSIEQANPYDKAVAPFIRDNPDKSFMFQDSAVAQRLGDSGFQKVTDPETGKFVEAGGQVLTFMPKTEHDKIVKRQEEMNRAQMGARRKAAQADAPEAEGLRHIGGITMRREGDARATVVEGTAARAIR